MVEDGHLCRLSLLHTLAARRCGTRRREVHSRFRGQVNRSNQRFLGDSSEEWRRGDSDPVPPKLRGRKFHAHSPYAWGGERIRRSQLPRGILGNRKRMDIPRLQEHIHCGATPRTTLSRSPLDMPCRWSSRDWPERRPGGRALYLQGLFQKPDTSVGEDSRASYGEQGRSSFQQGFSDSGGGGMEIVHLQVGNGEKGTGVHSRTQTKLSGKAGHRRGPCTSNRPKRQLHQRSHRDQGPVVVPHYQL